MKELLELFKQWNHKHNHALWSLVIFQNESGYIQNFNNDVMFCFNSIEELLTLLKK